MSNVLLLIFGLGVFRFANRNSALSITGGLLVANSVLSIISTAAWPGRLGEPPEAATIGVAVAATAVLCQVAAIAFGAFAYRNWFRFYSLGTLLLFAVLTVLGVFVQRAPHIGLQERVMAYLSLLWVLVLAVVLLHADEMTKRRADPG